MENEQTGLIIKDANGNASIWSDFPVPGHALILVWRAITSALKAREEMVANKKGIPETCGHISGDIIAIEAALRNHIPQIIKDRAEK